MADAVDDADEAVAEAVVATDVEMAAGRGDLSDVALVALVMMGGGGPRVETLGRTSPFRAARARKLISRERYDQQRGRSISGEGRG